MYLNACEIKHPQKKAQNVRIKDLPQKKHSGDQSQVMRQTLSEPEASPGSIKQQLLPFPKAAALLPHT